MERLPSSPRLTYRPLSAADADDFHALVVDPHVRRYLFDGQVLPPAWADEAIAKSRASVAREGLGLWLLVDAARPAAPIGFAGFFQLDDLGEGLQLIYALREDATGRGLATEAARAAIDLAREHAGVGAIWATVDAPNTASRRVLERLGFRPAKESPGAFGPILHLELPEGRPPKELATPRLLLRPWRAEDRAPFRALNADPRVMEHFPKRLDATESDALADRAEATFAAKGYGLWAVEVPGVAPFIGFVGLATPRFTAHFTPCVEIGWRLAAEHWGRGYATEAARAAVDAGFVHVGLDELVSFTVPANVRSRAVMVRLGMRHDPAGDFEHPNIPEGHALRRHVLHRLSRGEWRRGRG